MKIKMPFSFLRIGFVALFATTLIFSSCKKEEAAPDPLAELPDSFTKKVLIEEFTAEWCGACANAFPRIQTVMDENPNKVFAATIHVNDPFSNNQTSWLKSKFSISSFPSAMIDRYAFGGSTPRVSVSTSTMRGRSKTRMEETVNCGLKIESELLDGDLANIIVHVGQTQRIEGSPNLTVYLLEDDVPEVNQVSASSPDYKHHHVLRKILTEKAGDPITSETEGRDILTFKFDDIDISKYEKDNLEVIAFINYFDADDVSAHEIVNVQYAKLGTTQNWD